MTGADGNPWLWITISAAWRSLINVAHAKEVERGVAQPSTAVTSVMTATRLPLADKIPRRVGIGTMASHAPATPDDKPAPNRVGKRSPSDVMICLHIIMTRYDLLRDHFKLT